MKTTNMKSTAATTANTNKGGVDYNPFDYAVKDILDKTYDLTHVKRILLVKDYVGQHGLTTYLWSIEILGNTLITRVGTDIGGVVSLKEYSKQCLGYYFGKKPNVRWVSEPESARAQMARLVREKLGSGYLVKEISTLDETPQE